ncbi:MAG TPA: histidinol-phosphate transaminase, partial [Polyangiaceae bacterium]|nr:histidinol-phosphate transaminase [Polyangiaceae bacterium]
MASFSIAALTRPELAELSAYLPDLASYRIRLDANEAPPLLSESAHQRIAQVLSEGSWERYPDPTLSGLRQAIGSQLGL